MSLSFIYGAMNGGKSTLMLQAAHSSRSRGFDVILVGYKGNTRESSIRSRLGVEEKPDMLFSHETDLYGSLKEMLESRGKAKVLEILVDEAQFLTPAQVEQLFVLAAEEDVLVRCFGLRTTFEGRLFAGAARLFELADEVEELTLVRCRCGEKARFNARFSSTTGKLLAAGPEELIESSDEAIIYDPVCSKCFIALGGPVTSTLGDKR